MEKNEAWKWLILTVLTVLSVLLVVLPIDKPLSEKVPLGLDLRGGVSMILAIDGKMIREGIVQAAEEEGGVTPEQIEVRVANAMKDAQSRALQVVQNRVDAQGTREPIIYPEQGNNRIVVQIPGASEKERIAIEESLQQVAFLAFHLVHKRSDELSQNLMDSGVAPKGFRRVDVDGKPYLRRDYESNQEPDLANPFPDAKAPAGYTFLLHRLFLEQQGMDVYEPTCVKRRHEFTGELLKDASGEFTPLGQRYVSLQFNGPGARTFKRVTEDYAPRGEKNLDSDEGRQLAIALDHVIFSAPVIKQAIGGGRAQIDGHFPGDEADRLAQVLRTGALPAPVKIVEKRMVDPSLGRDSIQGGVRSVIIGSALVMLFMIIYYRLAGVIADLALVLNLVLLPIGMVLVAGFFGVFIGATSGANAFSLPVLTLPGIAGILLSIGMAVDANVLIHERMREEFRSGKRLLSAITAGYDRAFITILDSNLTTILTGVILYFCGGSGPIRGFAITLCAGILISMFTALVVTRLLFEHLAHRMKVDKLHMMQFIGETHIDFISKRGLAVMVSVVVIVVSWAIMLARGMPDPTRIFAVDFTGGSALTFTFTDKRPVEEVRDALLEADVRDAQIQYQKEISGTGEHLVIKAPADAAETVRDTLTGTLAGSGYEVIEEIKIDPQVGGELKSRALWAMVLSMIVMIGYISWRFEFGFSLGAITALVHDVLVTIGVFTLLGRQISLPIVAALLTIIGYSVNDTIVIFDRIRENLKLTPQKSFKDVCNESINQTLGRTLLTSFVTLLTVFALMIFGGGAINDFALALCIGMIAGVYSTVYIATPVTLLWHRNKRPDLSNK